MEDTTWAVRMSTDNVSPDDLLDALRVAQELGQEKFSNNVIGVTARDLLESDVFNAFVNSLMVGAQAFGTTTVALADGPVSMQIEVDYAEAE